MYNVITFKGKETFYSIMYNCIVVRRISKLNHCTCMYYLTHFLHKKKTNTKKKLQVELLYF